MNRKAEIFFDAITRLREDLVEDAQNHVFRKRRSGWRTFGSLAACMALVISLGMLAALPRGCGSANSDGSGADMNNSSAPMAQPPGVSGDTSSGGASPGGAPPASEELTRLAAVVLEIREDAILVELVGAGPQHQYLAPINGLDIPELTGGDRIIITCSPMIPEGDPYVIPGVQSIEKADVP